MAKSVARFQINRFKHEDLMRMYNCGASPNFINRRIGFKLHPMHLIIYILICIIAHLTIYFQMYTMEQTKSGLCPYDDQRYLLADLPNGRPNPNTSAYSHRYLAGEQHLVADQPKPGAKLIIQHPEQRFARRHARVTRRLKVAGAMEMEVELPDGDADCKLHNNQLLVADRVTAARPSGVICIGKVIERIIARDIFEQPFSPLAWM